MSLLNTVPQVTFKTRVRDESVPGPNPYRWQDLSTDEIFKGQTICRATKSFSTTSVAWESIRSSVCL
jgi:peroxiredoxin